MAKLAYYLFLSLLLAFASFEATRAHCVNETANDVVDGLQFIFNVTESGKKTGGYQQFMKQIGVEEAKGIVLGAARFVVNFLELYTKDELRDWKNITVTIDDFKTNEAECVYNKINVSAYWMDVWRENLTWQFNNTIYHEMVHVYQNDGNLKAPSGLVEGIADYVVFRANLAGTCGKKRGEGEKWDEGYRATAWFLEYIESLRPGFVVAMNKKIKSDYNPNYFVELTGKTVEQLWAEYKNKYKKT